MGNNELKTVWGAPLCGKREKAERGKVPLSCKKGDGKKETGGMVFGAANIVSFLSKLMTPDPGDIIATGTPAGVGFARRPPVYLRLKDVVEIEMDWVYLKIVWPKNELGGAARAD